MAPRHRAAAQPRPKTRRAYAIVDRGADGRPRLERFTDAQSYRARLAALEHSDKRSLTIDEIACLLDS
jgi:hypothetical protein